MDNAEKKGENGSTKTGLEDQFQSRYPEAYETDVTAKCPNCGEISGQLIEEQTTLCPDCLEPVEGVWMQKKQKDQSIVSTVTSEEYLEDIY